MTMDNHAPDQQSFKKTLAWMTQAFLRVDSKCAQSQISFESARFSQDEHQKKQELLNNHYAFVYINLYLLALARSSRSSHIRVFQSLMYHRILSLIQSFAEDSPAWKWLEDVVSQMAVVMAFLCTLLPNNHVYFIECISELYKFVTALS